MSQVSHRIAGGRLVTIGPKRLEGLLTIPEGAKGLIIFAHGSGSGRSAHATLTWLSSYQSRGMATLLFDLLTEEEASDRRNVFDVPLLATRLEEAVTWARADAEVAAFEIGFFGASTGSAAALVAAAHIPEQISVIVSRGGRPDLANATLLDKVRAPTLLIVGGDDSGVLELNRERFQQAELRQEPVGGARRHPSVRGAGSARPGCAGGR